MLVNSKLGNTYNIHQVPSIYVQYQISLEARRKMTIIHLADSISHCYSTNDLEKETEAQRKHKAFYVCICVF